ncbi:Gp49 family protein [Anaerotignum sp.]
MRDYISIDMVKATPVVAVDGKLYDALLCEIPNGEKTEYGYKIGFDNGVENFCNKEEFEKFFLLLDTNKNLKTEKPSISERMVDHFIARFYSATVGDKTTMVRAVLVNGFEIVESSSCVSPENYDEEIGKEICIGKIKDKVWELLGFLLATAVNGFNYETRYPSTLHEEMKGSLEEDLMARYPVITPLGDFSNEKETEEEKLPFADLPEGEDCKEDCCDSEPCEEACGCPLPQTPYGSEGYCPDPAEDCEKTEGDYHEVHSKVKRSKEPVSIIIAEEEGNRLKIEMNGESEFVFAALESAVVAAFCAEFHEANIEMQKLVADSWAADIGRRIRDTILGTVTTEKR